VSHLTNDLQDAGAIQRCAAKADIP